MGLGGVFFVLLPALLTPQPPAPGVDHRGKIGGARDCRQGACTSAKRGCHDRTLRRRLSWSVSCVSPVHVAGFGRATTRWQRDGHADPLSGIDPSLYERARAQAKPGGGASIAAAEDTLRGYWQDHEAKNGPIVDWQALPDPPSGSSGIQFTVRISGMLEGYRPTRVVRFRPNGFPNVKLPAEEWLNWKLESPEAAGGLTNGNAAHLGGSPDT
jgi:hypothetical protein